jgi:hypothetical protein|tara:strand:+ start:378 stop:566 length:189 start_codon:yes stop_codon:yes gene_type:complete
MVRQNMAIACLFLHRCSGIFAWISANAVQEAEDEGKKRITPWWRTLKAKGELNPKYPGGVNN